MTTLVDTSVFIDYFNGIKNRYTDELDYLLEQSLIITGDYILAEVLQGFRSNKDFAIAKKLMLIFPCYNLCNKEIAIKSAEYFRYLKSKGYTIRKPVDMIIGTFCIENKISLLHNDKDFKPMELHLGLKTR